ncbi:MAG: hypothetical protein ACWGMZ_13145 [Thermoguttaceae bacterium]
MCDDQRGHADHGCAAVPDGALSVLASGPFRQNGPVCFLVSTVNQGFGWPVESFDKWHHS